jgi:Glycosyl hydrolase family 48
MVGCLPPRQGSEPRAPGVAIHDRGTVAGGAQPSLERPEDIGSPVRPPYRPFEAKLANTYLDRFAALWNDIHNPANGYFSPQGVPYHSTETLNAEAPDYGHETTSEAYSYYIWLEATYGKLSKDWSYLDAAWSNLERYIIPRQADQPTSSTYNAHHPATFAPELETPNQYPSALDNKVRVGVDPIYEELRTTYGTADIYGMHWILDVDNWYGFGNHADGASKPSYINTFQRGPQESVFETVTQPCWDEFKFGGKQGYLDLFVKNPGGGGAAKQWKYTTAPDADARAIQAVYWAKVWADETGGSAAVANVVKKASRLGDYLRYALFDKYFKSQGCTSPDCPAAADDRGGAHYLLSWYYAWGGSIAKAGGWAWRIGSSAAHGGYQNPLAAYVLAKVPDFKPASPTAAKDWDTSLGRQIEFYRWLQSAEGAIGGGASNGWAGRYGPYPAGTHTFYGLGYDEQPVYHDPPSNSWFGFQVWSMDRVAQYYYVTGDDRAKVILGKWVAWVVASIQFKGDDYAVPSTLEWSGQPKLDWTEKTQSFNPADRSYNAGLHVKIKNWGNDAGVASATARTLAYWAARSGDKKAQRTAKELLDRLWSKYRDAKGVSTPEDRADYKRFNDPVFVPAGWTGKMPNGDVIDGASTFLGIRSKYRQDPDWPQLQTFLSGGHPPKMTYHRFWAQSDIAIANAAYGMLFPRDGAAGTPVGATDHNKGKGKKKGGP